MHPALQHHLIHGHGHDVQLMKPFYRTPVRTAAMLMREHLEHHVALGFDGMVLYERPGFAEALASHSALTEYVAAGRLTIVRWEDVPFQTQR